MHQTLLKAVHRRIQPCLQRLIGYFSGSEATGELPHPCDEAYPEQGRRNQEYANP